MARDRVQVVDPLPSHVAVLVVGAGFGGLGAAIRLQDEGRDFLVVERATDVGGTWRDNSYPGCVCDVPSHLYSFSFAPNPEWSRSLSPQPEILEYLRRTARERGVLGRVRFGTDVLAARWESNDQRWHVRTTRGELTADAVVLATGPLSEPSTPTVPGLEIFAGTTFHSAGWRHDHDLRGERVAVVGTGASAVQFVPHVQRAARQLTVIQRSAPWVLPRRDRVITETERRLFRRLPVAQRVARAAIYSSRESWVLGFTHPRLMTMAERGARAYLKRQVSDAELRAKLTPHYRLGCKRVLLSNDYYPALTQDNVEVVPGELVEVRERAVVTAMPDGERREHAVDTIIFGTGFRVTEPAVATRVVGADGRTLADRWAVEGMSAYRGLTIAGFPNLFFLLGPNTGLGHTSVVIAAEAQVEYVLDALRQLESRGGGAIEVREDVQRAYNRKLQRRLAGTVWNTGGCASWYLDERGRNTTLWPTFVTSLRRQVARCDLADYVVHAPVRRAADVSA